MTFLFFSGAPDCLIKDGLSYHSDKSVIIKLIVPVAASKLCKEAEYPKSHSYIADLSVEIRSFAAIFESTGKTYRDFVIFVLEKIAQKANKMEATQIDIVADFYHDLSIKAGTRNSRGQGSRELFTLETFLPDDFEKCFENNSFKCDLNNCFARPDILAAWGWQRDYCVTKERFVIERTNGSFSERLICLQPNCQSLEEADNRIVVHIRDVICMRGHSSILVRTNDSDVVVILISFMVQFLEYNKAASVTVEFGTGDTRRFISINECLEHLGENVALALNFFHAFSGADSTSSFYRKGKTVLYNSWMNYPMFEDLTSTFQKLSWLPSDETIKESLLMIQNFLYYVYRPSSNPSPQNDLDELRMDLFKSSTTNSFRDLPPSTDGLGLHVRRSAYQSGWVWGNSISQEKCPSIEESGWIVESGKIGFRWSISFDPNMIIKVTKSCKCKQGSSKTKKCNSCSCAKSNVACLEQCDCVRTCAIK